MEAKDPHHFTHTVFFWLKEPNNESHKEQLIQGLKKLVANSQYSKMGHIGYPAGTDRPVVDNSYDCSLFVTFESSEDQDKYQTELSHLEFLEACKSLWSKVQIYDALRVD